MNCPYCDFHFGAALSNGHWTPDVVAPILCENCAQIALLENGHIRQMTKEELDILKTAPCWKEFLEPALEIVLQNKFIQNSARTVN